MKSHSDQQQDIFVSTLIKEQGFFLDIGGAGPTSGNNTYLLETLGWYGLSVDLNPIDGWRNRITKCIQLDATKVNWLEFLEQNNVPKVIDYISMDIDHGNLELIINFPFEQYQFKILTFETNQWAYLTYGFPPWPPLQEESLKILNKYSQYKRLATDITYEGRAFEDWWINTKFFNDKINNLCYNNMDWKDIVNNICQLKQ